MFHFGFLGFPFFIVSAAFYFLPTIIGSARHKTNLVGIFLVNFFLGWSVIGWIVAMVWAVSTERVDQIAGSLPVSRPSPMPAPQSSGRYCTSCGSAGQAGQFCAHCGQRLS
jgi:hypothetical protein